MVLPAITSISPVFATRHFFIIITITVVLTVLINGIIDYFLNRDKAVHYISDGFNTIVTVSLFLIIIGILQFFSSGDTHKRIKSGVTAPVAKEVYDRGILPKVFFFSLRFSNWKIRFPLFLVNVIWFPGVPTLLLITLYCWTAVDFQPLKSAENCPTTSIWRMVLWTELWKGITAGIVCAMNYAAAHHEGQPEVVPADETQDLLNNTTQAEGSPIPQPHDGSASPDPARGPSFADKPQKEV